MFSGHPSVGAYVRPSVRRASLLACLESSGRSSSQLSQWLRSFSQIRSLRSIWEKSAVLFHCSDQSDQNAPRSYSPIRCLINCIVGSMGVAKQQSDLKRSFSQIYQIDLSKLKKNAANVSVSYCGGRRHPRRRLGCHLFRAARCVITQTRPLRFAESLLFLSFFLFFYSVRDLRGLSADRRETLQHDRKSVQF